MMKFNKKNKMIVLRVEFSTRHPHQGHGKGHHSGFAERSPPA